MSKNGVQMKHCFSFRQAIVLSIATLFTLLVVSCAPAQEEAAPQPLKIGDQLLFSDKVICNKAFDAAGPHGGNEDRLNNGSNLWQTSNIRATSPVAPRNDR